MSSRRRHGQSDRARLPPAPALRALAPLPAIGLRFAWPVRLLGWVIGLRASDDGFKAGRASRRPVDGRHFPHLSGRASLRLLCLAWIALRAKAGAMPPMTVIQPQASALMTGRALRPLTLAGTHKSVEPGELAQSGALASRTPPVRLLWRSWSHRDELGVDERAVGRSASMIASSPTPIPVTLMNHGVDETAAIIGAVVERCARDNIALTEIFIDPELAELLGLVDGGQLPHGSRPTVRCEAGLGRQVRFQKA